MSEELDRRFCHLLFGKLCIRQWYDLIALHELWHLAQFKEMMKNWNEEKGGE
ncbi:hypothetical protein [Ferroacidibacillus organovorans]|uniref:hypothetical protein n=1 Tax=Ferroacidibacillus organovorans TaxID=1765683 RepID=UPI0013656462|nr:hypothetical protein [Ferroacidibacillus organovorans]